MDNQRYAMVGSTPKEKNHDKYFINDDPLSDEEKEFENLQKEIIHNNIK